MGQNFPDLHREQFSFGGISTAFRKRPYFLLGMDCPFLEGIQS